MVSVKDPLGLGVCVRAPAHQTNLEIKKYIMTEMCQNWVSGPLLFISLNKPLQIYCSKIINILLILQQFITVYRWGIGLPQTSLSSFLQCGSDSFNFL